MLFLRASACINDVYRIGMINGRVKLRGRQSRAFLCASQISCNENGWRSKAEDANTYTAAGCVAGGWREVCRECQDLQRLDRDKDD